MHLETLQELLPVGDGTFMFRNAILLTLKAQPEERIALFEALVKYIHQSAVFDDVYKTWDYHVHTGTDGSRIFRGGIGFSLVIDPHGRIWRAATHEDFETTYTLTPTSCEIATMTPLYATMREYVLSYYEEEEK